MRARLSGSIALFYCMTSGCQTDPFKHSWQPDDFVIQDQQEIDPPTGELTHAQVQTDVSYLIHALKTGYGGRKFVDQTVFSQALTGLQQINGPQTAASLRDAIDSILTDIPDNHLGAHIKWEYSQKRQNMKKKSQVGENCCSLPDRPWSVQLKPQGKHRIALISITKFPSYKDPVWNGFLTAAEKTISRASHVILDMRSNGGGDDTMGIKLAQHLSPQPFRYPIHRQVVSQTPESNAVFLNRLNLNILMFKKMGKDVPPHFYALQKERQQQYESAKSGKIPNETSEQFISDIGPQPKRFKFKGPIYILQNATCASSCESTIDAFEFIPLVKRVGEPTGGYIHYGNVGLILLPHSKIAVSIPTHYSEYFDQRMIERSGIKPDVVVPPGTDALQFILKEI